jgi:hypothetical protein
MNIDNGDKAMLDIPGVFSGLAGGRGRIFAFPSPAPITRTSVGTIDGRPVRFSIRPDASFQRPYGMLIATIIG